MSKLSFIIPMYNAEKVIERTLRSILDANLPRDFYEVIVVDDGSTDASLEVVSNLKQLFVKMKVITQSNGGASKARNRGLRESSAEYIWFVDADDVVEKDLSCVLELLSKYPNVDIFSFAYNWLSEDGQHLGYGQLQENVSHNVVLSGRDAIIQGYQPGSVCGLIIRKAFLVENSLTFREGITQEDSELTFRMFARAENCFFSTKLIYNYVFTPDSVTRNTDAQKRIKYAIDSVEVIKSFMHQASLFRDTDKELSLAMRRYAESTLFGYVYELFTNRHKWRRNGINSAAITALKTEELYPLRLKTADWKKCILCRILNIEKLIN